MANVRYYSVCRCCGKRGSSTSRPENAGPPSSSPPSMSGKCPGSYDGKHKPCWEKG